LKRKKKGREKSSNKKQKLRWRGKEIFRYFFLFKQN